MSTLSKKKLGWMVQFRKTDQTFEQNGTHSNIMERLSYIDGANTGRRKHAVAAIPEGFCHLGPLTGGGDEYVLPSRASKNGDGRVLVCTDVEIHWPPYINHRKKEGILDGN